MDEVTDMKSVCFTNLLLLGLEPAGLERRWRIPINKDMFVMQNKKAFEVVMFFLFRTLDATQADELFRYCKEPSDRKQEAQFRKVCHDWLSRIAKDDPDAHLPRIVASTFLAPGGDKFYELLFYFSVYIMRRKVTTEMGFRRRDVVARPTLTSQTQQLGHVMRDGARCAAHARKLSFLHRGANIGAVQTTWKEFATEQVKRNRALTRAVRDLEREVKDETERIVARDAARDSSSAGKRSSVEGYSVGIQSVRRTQRVQKVRELWRELERHLAAGAEQRDVVTSVVTGATDRFRLDGAELRVTVPERLLRECEQEIHARSVANIYEGGKLNLLSLLQLWNLSLHLYLEKIQEVGLADFEDAVPTVTSHLHTHQAHLSTARTLRHKLGDEILPDLKQSVWSLRKQLDSTLLKAQSPGSVRATPLGLGLLPPTPPVTFEASEKDYTPLSRAERGPARRESVATPEAALQLMDEISREVREKQRSHVTRETQRFGWEKPPEGARFTSPGVAVRTARENGDARKGAGTAASTQKDPRRGNRKWTSAGSQKRAGTAAGAWKGTGTTAAAAGKRPSSKVPQVSARHVTPSGGSVKTSARLVTPSGGSVASRLPQRDAPTGGAPEFKVPVSTGKKPEAPGVDKVTPAVARQPRMPLDILADRMVDAMLGDESEEFDFALPLGVGTDAFVSKDKLMRTPPTEQREPVGERDPGGTRDPVHSPAGSPRDYSLLSEPHMASPLSSTKLDGAGIIAHDAVTDVATRLFAGESDGEDDDEIVTAGPDISPTPPSTLSLSHHTPTAPAKTLGHASPAHTNLGYSDLIRTSPAQITAPAHPTLAHTRPAHAHTSSPASRVRSNAPAQGRSPVRSATAQGPSPRERETLQEPGGVVGHGSSPEGSRGGTAVTGGLFSPGRPSPSAAGGPGSPAAAPPGPSTRRLDGDGGPAFDPATLGGASKRDASTDENMNNAASPALGQRDVREESANKLNANLSDLHTTPPNRSRSHGDEERLLLSPSGQSYLTLKSTSALYEELNQSKTPELPHIRSRRGAEESLNQTAEKVVPTAASPHRSPEVEEIHRSLDHFEDLMTSIQEAASHIGSRSARGDAVMDAADLLNANIADETFPEDLFGDEEEELGNTSARVIEVQNGNFSEILVGSPGKRDFARRSVERQRLSASFSLTTQNDLGRHHDDNADALLSQTLPESRSPVSKEILGSLDAQTQNLIERFKRLRQASASRDAAGSDVTEDSPVSPRNVSADRPEAIGTAAQVFSPSPSRDAPTRTPPGVSPETSAAVPSGEEPESERHLQETTNKTKVRRSKKVSLAFGLDLDRVPEDESAAPPRDDDATPLEPRAADAAVFKKPATPPRVPQKQNGQGDLVVFSPFSTPKRSTSQDGFPGAEVGSPMFGLHSVPLSPMTDALHKETLTPRTRKRRSVIQSILDEDDSILLPVSPPT